MNTPKSKKLFRDRLILVAGELSFRELGKITETSPESVRRYMNGHTPSTVFVSKLCSGLGVSVGWLLLGNLPMMTLDVPHYIMKNANPEQLMAAVTAMLVDMAERLERLEKLEKLEKDEHLTKTGRMIESMQGVNVKLGAAV